MEDAGTGPSAPTLTASLLAPPAAVRGMCELDRSAFRSTLRLAALRVPQQHCATLLHAARKCGCLLVGRGLRAVQQGSETADACAGASPAFRTILLDPRFRTEDDLRHLPEPLVACARETGAELCWRELVLDYESFSAEQVLRAVLPETLSIIPTAFETAGHIAHMNLRSEFEPHKHLIGRVILDKNYPRIRTVVNKLEAIQTAFRFFEFEVLAGDDDTVIEVHESGCARVLAAPGRAAQRSRRRALDALFASTIASRTGTRA